MGMWFWLSIPLALLFFACWAGIPLWLTLTRWNTELNAKHAEIAASTGPLPVFAQPAPAAVDETSSPVYAAAANPSGRQVPSAVTIRGRPDSEPAPFQGEVVRGWRARALQPLESDCGRGSEVPVCAGMRTQPHVNPCCQAAWCIHVGAGPEEHVRYQPADVFDVPDSEEVLAGVGG
jgi:hypothetical protein